MPVWRDPRFAATPRTSRLVVPATLTILFSLGACNHTKGPTEAQAQDDRLSCRFTAGALPSATLAATDPTGTQIPIDHIVLVMQENRSFDSYFSHLQVPGQTVESAADDVTNPNGDGGVVSRFHWDSSTASNGNPNGLDYYCFADTDHGWGQTHAEWNNGALDGFVTTNNDSGNGARAMGYYDQTDIPFYYGLAQSFAISDRHFCSVLGPTYPNRMFYWAGTSYGLGYNSLAPATGSGDPAYPNLFTELTAAHVSWKVYSLSLPSSALVWESGLNSPANFPGLPQFYADAQQGQLPAVSVVEGNDSGAGSITVNGSTIVAVDEHPPQDPQLGQSFMASVVQALMHSPNWSSSALFITWDEHGGEYDHVPPPPACKPDNMPLQLGSGDGGYLEWSQEGFDRYGFRTPLFVVSPYAKRGYVSHVVVDHTSITRFVETRFDLPALTARDANAWPLLDMFDFSHPDMTVPTLPESVIEPAQQAQCASPDGGYPPSGTGF
jgi:phospholipase C